MFRKIDVVVPPQEEPVDLAEALAQVRGVLEGDDGIFQAKLIAARERCEGFTRRSLITQTLDVWYDDPSGIGYFELPRGKVQQVVSVETIDLYGLSTTLEPDLYTVSGTLLTYGVSGWVTAYRPSFGIKIRIVSGYGNAEDVPEALKQGILEYTAFTYENRLGEPPNVKFAASITSGGTTGGLPVGVYEKWQPYQVRYV